MGDESVEKFQFLNLYPQLICIIICDFSYSLFFYRTVSHCIVTVFTCFLTYFSLCLKRLMFCKSNFWNWLIQYLWTLVLLKTVYQLWWQVWTQKMHPNASCLYWCWSLKLGDTHTHACITFASIPSWWYCFLVLLNP